MMKRLRGRNLKHPGCLIGVTTGLIVGIVLAGALAYAGVSFTLLAWFWLGLTFVLGASGWLIGDRLSSHFPAEGNEDQAVRDLEAKAVGETQNKSGGNIAEDPQR